MWSCNSWKVLMKDTKSSILKACSVYCNLANMKHKKLTKLLGYCLMKLTRNFMIELNWDKRDQLLLKRYPKLTNHFKLSKIRNKILKNKSSFIIRKQEWRGTYLTKLKNYQMYWWKLRTLCLTNPKEPINYLKILTKIRMDTSRSRIWNRNSRRWIYSMDRKSEY